MEDAPKPVVWLGSSRKDLKAFPQKVRGNIGHALYPAQMGETDPAAKPLKGLGDAKVMEIVDRHDSNTYRARLYGSVRRSDLRAPCLPEEIEAGHCDPEEGDRPH